MPNESPRRRPLAGALLLATLCAGCTDAGLYRFGQDLGRGKADCAALISQAEVARCEARFDRTHEEYERERRALRDG